MTREQQVAEVLKANAELVALLTGGIYVDQEIGIEGIHRGEESLTAAAFDENGYILPCALVVQDGPIPYGGNVRNLKDKFVATNQMVRIFYYQHRKSDVIEEAKLLVYSLLEGYKFTDAYPIWWEYETPYLYDVGPVSNSTTCRQDWNAVSIRQG